MKPSIIVFAVLLSSCAAALAQTRVDAPASDRRQAMQAAAEALAVGRRAEAADMYRAIADRDQSVQALLQLARIQSGDGDAQGAIESLRRARALAPNSEEVLSALAQVSLATRALVPAILTLESLTRMCPTVAQYHYLLGVALMQAGEMIGATEMLERAEQLEAGRLLTLVALGLAYNNRKMYAEALTPLRRAVEIEPDNVEAVAALAEAEEGMGAEQPAESHARRALEQTPQHARANLVLGLVLMRKQRFEEARDAFLRAAAADPLLPRPHYQLSLAYARLEDHASSAKHREIYQQKLREFEARLQQLRANTGFGTGGGMRP
ncbi:MAG TPA: tetratricopeptide repeat protein [Vicinamibacterales bacterium]|nr:tetratricopeptide repeat protein [Vicinamibacterales bacterium]